MSNMFSGATAFNQSLNSWTVSSVTNMRYMFDGATSFNQNISGWANKIGRRTAFMFFRVTAMQTSHKPSSAGGFL